MYVPILQFKSIDDLNNTLTKVNAQGSDLASQFNSLLQTLIPINDATIFLDSEFIEKIARAIGGRFIVNAGQGYLVELANTQGRLKELTIPSSSGINLITFDTSDMSLIQQTKSGLIRYAPSITINNPVLFTPNSQQYSIKFVKPMLRVVVLS